MLAERSLDLLNDLQRLLLLVYEIHDLSLLLKRVQYALLIFEGAHDFVLLKLNLRNTRTGLPHLHPMLIINFSQDGLGQSTDFAQAFFEG